MNPLSMLKLYRKVNQVVSLFQQATASYERTHAVSKSLFASKTFWFNALSAGAEALQLISKTQIVPPGAIAIVSGFVNIALRMVTTQPVHVGDPNA